jgi:ABC-type phosphate transport system auxiliary subunit
LQARSQRLVEAETEVHQLKKSAPESLSVGIANALEKAEKHHVAEKQELIDRLETVEQELRKAQCSIADKTKAMAAMQEQETKAELAVSQYSEMTEYYKDLMAKYAPGLGAGLFLERAIQRKATTHAMA